MMSARLTFVSYRIVNELSTPMLTEGIPGIEPTSFSVRLAR